MSSYSVLSLQGQGFLLVWIDKDGLGRSRFCAAPEVDKLPVSDQVKANVKKQVAEYDSSSQMPVLMIDPPNKHVEFEVMPCGLVKLPFIGYVD